MSAPRPVFTPNGSTSWLDWVLDPRTNAVLFDEVDHARAELAELRKERDELRAELRRLWAMEAELAELRKELSEARNEAQRLEDKLAGAIEDLNHANEYINTAAGIIKERNELREAILKLGYLTGTENYCGDHVMLTVRLNPQEAHAWNTLVAKVSAEVKP